MAPSECEPLGCVASPTLPARSAERRDWGGVRGWGWAASLPVTSWTPCLGHVGTAGILPCSSCFSGLDARMEVTGHASEMPANLQTPGRGGVRGGTGDKHGR